MRNYTTSIKWRELKPRIPNSISGRMSSVRAATVGDALGIALDKVQRLHARGTIEITAISVQEEDHEERR